MFYDSGYFVFGNKNKLREMFILIMNNLVMNVFRSQLARCIDVVLNTILWRCNKEVAVA